MRAVYFSLACVMAMGPMTARGQMPGDKLAIVPSAPAVLKTGTEIQLKLEEPLSTERKLVRVGQHFHLAVVEPVRVNGEIVIPVGSPAIGEVSEVRNKGMWGKSGHITATLLYVSVNDRQIRLTGTFDEKGTTGTAGVVAAIAFVPVAGFFTTGTSARIPEGAQVKGFIGEDVPLVFQKAEHPPLPLAVPATDGHPVNAPATAEIRH